jgi:peptidoglycan/LPS O-acetylase OafA/YrhL
MKERNLQLDLLRCAAILAVLVAHTGLFRAPASWLEGLVVRPSWTGVDLFFVISGFLISGLLFTEFQKRDQINFRRFAVRRALKLYPTLYVLVFGVAFTRLTKSGFTNIYENVQPLLHDVLFVQSYFPGTYGHFWSLAVEEHFYILLGILLFVMLRRARSGEVDPFRRLPVVFAVVALFCLSTRLIHAIRVPNYSYFTHLFPTHFRLDSLLFGVLLSYWYHFHPARFVSTIRRNHRLLFPTALLLIAPAFIWEQSNFFTYTVGLSLLYLGYGALMIWLLQVPLTTRGFTGRLLGTFAYIGRHSYPIYLFHIAVLQELLKYKALPSRPGEVIYFIGSIAVGIFFSKVIEFPVLRLRDRIFPAEVLPIVPTRSAGPNR